MPRRFAPDTLSRGDDWTRLALCRNYDPDLWFPDSGGKGSALAKAVCAMCPVRPQCLSYAKALRRGSHYGVVGIWGGRTWGKPR